MQDWQIDKVVEVAPGTLQVDTPSGFVDVLRMFRTLHMAVWELQTTDYTLRGAQQHRVKLVGGPCVWLSDLQPGDLVDSETGPQLVVKITPPKDEDAWEQFYDMEIDTPDHLYYTGGLLSHNSTTLGVRQLVNASLLPKYRSLYVVPHEEHRKTYANRLREMERAFAFPVNSPSHRQNLNYKEYPNGSVIELIRMLSTAAEARGKTSDEIVVDESVCGCTLVSSLSAAGEGYKVVDKKIGEMLVGDCVVSADAEDRTHKRKVTDFYNKGAQHVWDVVFSDGSKITCTGSTRFRTDKGFQHLCEFITPEEASRCGRTYKIKSLITAAETAFTGDTPWRREHEPIKWLRDALPNKPELQTIGVRVEDTGIVVLLHEDTSEVPREYGVWESQLCRQHTNNSCVQFYTGPRLQDGCRFRQGVESGRDSSLLTPVGLETITYAGKQDVYDIEVEDHHTFFANGILVHNCQHMDASLMPELEQVQKASPMPSTVYSGTSLTIDTLLEAKWDMSSQGSWHIRAGDGKNWINCADPDEAIKMIQPEGLTCPHTSKILDPSQGEFVHAFPNLLKAGYKGLHIPQIVIPDFVGKPNKWNEIWKAFCEYDRKKFLQEILGIPTAEGAREITEQDLKDMCVLPSKDQLMKDVIGKKYKYIISGCDWGGSDYNPATRTKLSYTVHAILGLAKNGDFHILHIRRYSGMKYQEVINEIIKDHKRYRGTAMASDFGVGAAYNMLLRESPYINSDQHLILGYVGPKAAPIAPPSGHSWYNQFSINRTESITKLYTDIRRVDPRIKCFPWDECATYMDDFLNLYRVPVENQTTGATEFKYQRHGSKTDDTLHAVNFAYILGRLLKGEPLLEDRALMEQVRSKLSGGVMGGSHLGHRVPPVISG